MDLTGFFQAIQNGGPPVIFVLSVLCGLFMTGQLRVKREVEDRDKIIQQLESRNKELGDRYTREHELFSSALSLIRDELLPMVRDDDPPVRRRRRSEVD